MINQWLRRSRHKVFMEKYPAHLVLTLETKGPIQLADFVSAFTSIAAQYEDFIRKDYPALKSESKMYVTEVRHGSIQADLIPYLVSVAGPAIVAMDQALIIEQFVKAYGSRLMAYLQGGRVEAATKSDLKDFMGQIVAIANDPAGTATLESVQYEDGKRQVRASVKFSTREARVGVQAIEDHRRENERATSADYARVLMVFSQSNTKNVELHKRSGERVIIEAVSAQERPLIYASELAEQRIKHEIREADENVYKKGFIVDVNVQTSNGRPIGYRVTNLHQVIDL